MNTVALLREAIALGSRGDVVGAAAHCRKVLAREPGNIDAMFLLAQAYCQQGQFERGGECLRKVIARQPGHAPAHGLLGMVLQRSGRPQDALVCFDRALQIDPQNIAAIISKADSLSELGRPADAVPQFERALALDGNNVVAWCNRGLALETLGRDADAAESFERALALAPDLPEIHFNLANALHRLGRHDEAVSHYRRAIALNPRLPRAHANLTATLFPLRRWQEALQSVEQAIKLQPGDALLHDAKGQVLWNHDRHHESLACFDRALAIDPTNSTTLNNKARLLYVLGRLDEARSLIEKAIDLDPGNTRNYLDLGVLKRFAPDDPQVVAMENLLPGIDTQPEQKQIDLHFALAKAYKDVGKHVESFRHLAKGTTLKRRQSDYDETDVIDNLDLIAQVFSTDLMHEKSGHGDPSALPIFIVGMPRSGTTLIEQILASHPRVQGAGERKDFEQALSSLKLPTAYPEAIAAMDPEQMKEVGAAYMASMTASAPAADRITDKMPANYIYAGLIHLALPNARIVHARRNPVDTCLSCFSTLFKEKMPFTYDLGELGRYYRAYERLMEHWRKVLPSGVMLEVQYEDVVDNLEVQARRILAHCGLEWDAACLTFHKLDRPVLTASAGQVRQPIYRTSVEAWRPYRDQLAPLLEALGLTET